MADLPPLNNRSFPNADEHLSRLLAPDLEEPWFKSLYGNLREFLSPRKLPPLEVTSRPVVVKDIWGNYGPQKKCWVMSLGFQSILVLLLFTVFSANVVQHKMA